jgi:long-chain acyl-CoA synthetase
MAPLPAAVKHEFESKYGVSVLESYGLSELFLVSSNVPNVAQAPGAAGRVLPGITIEVLDEAGQPLPGGEEGEIVIHSPWRMKGYLDYERSEPDASVVEQGFATGDIGRLDEEGNLYITGRRKDLIIRGGLNISPRTIEDVLIAHPAVEDVAVVGIPHEFSGEEIVAFLKLRPGASLDDERGSILGLCKKRLNHIAVPNRFLSVDTLPRSKAGKILKRVLREQVLKARP